MTDRFAKVPEWLLTALRYAPREPGDATGSVALRVYAELALRADYRTWRVLVRFPIITENCGLSERSVRRGFALLRRLGALTVEGSWATLAVENPDTSGTLPGTGATETGTRAKSTPRVPAGQDRRRATPQRYIQSPLVAVVPDEPAVPMPPSVREQLNRPLRALRQEDDDPTRMPDTTGTRGEDADEERTGTE